MSKAAMILFLFVSSAHATRSSDVAVGAEGENQQKYVDAPRYSEEAEMGCILGVAAMRSPKTKVRLEDVGLVKYVESIENGCPGNQAAFDKAKQKLGLGGGNQALCDFAGRQTRLHQANRALAQRWFNVFSFNGCEGRGG